eukprot:TRINITY_DN65872_c0_g1_i1.p1 TRINITY_DN65872_c0_g1~~TRINITY_DN65872_c0_g1_i1.p1  ORF type:complete len:191 (-),score=16.93 TRINITY_DN65872_c0_g1_i1:218-751(-)
MTNEQFGLVTYRRKETVDTIRSLVQSQKFDVLVDSRLWFRKDGPMSSLRELYPDIGIAGDPGADLIPELQGLGLHFVEKLNYSSFAGGSKLDCCLREKGVTEVALTGINTDYCIFATALDAFYAGFKVSVIQDGCTSVGGKDAHREGLLMIDKFLGDVALDAKDVMSCRVRKRPAAG